MWFLKKTAENVWNASKNLVDNRSEVEKLIDTIANSNQEILPTNKLNQLATMTYDMETFDQILQLLTKKLKVFHYDSEEANKTLNLLIATNYLIKHGATGFVDEFRQYLGVFQKYQTLKRVKVYQDEITQQKLDYTLEKIKSRAQHITVLLQDKEKLLKEKELSMLVKQKLKLYEKSKLSDLKNERYSNQSSREHRPKPAAHSEQLSGRLEGLMEKYLWKYVDKLDDTIEVASDKIMQQIDKYILGEEPATFEVEAAEVIEDEEESKQAKEKRREEDDLMKKLEQESSQAPSGTAMGNLLDFDEVMNQKPKQEGKPGAPQAQNLLD